MESGTTAKAETRRNSTQEAGSTESFVGVLEVSQMDFASMLPSSLGLGGEFLTPVGKEVEQATSESLVSPDWGLNMQICDEVSVAPHASTGWC